MSLELNELLYLRETTCWLRNQWCDAPCACIICTRAASRHALRSWQICLRFLWHFPQTTDINRHNAIYLRANDVKTIKSRSQREDRRAVNARKRAFVAIIIHSRELFRSRHSVDNNSQTLKEREIKILDSSRSSLLSTLRLRHAICRYHYYIL